MQSKPRLIFLTQKPLGYDPLADKGPLGRGTSDAVPPLDDAAAEAADNQMVLKAVRSIAAPGDPEIAADEENADLPYGLVEMTLKLPHEGPNHEHRAGTRPTGAGLGS